MKTAQIMERSLMGLTVRQNHKTEMLNANDLHIVGNKLRKSRGETVKQINSYFILDSTIELISEICAIDCLDETEVKLSTRGKTGGTWVHPVVFIDMAMWYSPELKVRILKWVQDGLLMARDNSGDSFKVMMDALTKNFPDEMDDGKKYVAISNAIAAECRVGRGADRWSKATEDQLKLRDKIQNNVALIADLCPNIGSCVKKAIEKATNK